MMQKCILPGRRVLFFAILTFLALAGTSLGASLRVPSQYPTIQAGIDAASSGDSVVVADGTYRGDGNTGLDLKGKTITVQSENGANSTIIDCEGAGVGFYFHSEESSPSVVSGFTISNAVTGIYIDNFPSFSSPTISSCRITGSSGGGIYVGHYSSPLITNCTIEGNDGNGIYCSQSNATITNCTISNNRAQGIGGGIYLYFESHPTIINCTISENSVSGIYMTDSWPTITSSTITGNSSPDCGGGMYLSVSYPTVVNSIIAGNTALHYGGGICIHYSSATLTNCTISGNSSGIAGGAIHATLEPGYDKVVVTNTIVWGNSPDGIAYTGGSNWDVSYSDIQGGFSGTGNIDEDPLFVDEENGDFHLNENSPAIDAGINPDSSDTPAKDRDGNPRVVNGLIDMGAYEYQGIVKPSLSINLSDAYRRMGIFEIQRTGDSSLPLKVHYAVNATAAKGQHYWSIESQMVMSAGRSSLLLPIPSRFLLNHGVGALTVSLSASRDYTISSRGSVTVTRKTTDV